MTKRTMTAQNTPKDPTVYDVIEWLRARSNETTVAGASFRGWQVALEQLANLIADDEPKDIHWMYVRTNQLRDRWCRRHPDKRIMTAHSYASRARRVIKQYLRWTDNPEGYTFSPRKNAVKKKLEPVSSDESPALDKPKNDFHSFVLEDGESILFKLPECGITKADVQKFEMHLFTLATDFDVQCVLKSYKRNKDTRVTQLVHQLAEEA